ncbi:hypothetical protein TPHA_0K01000 [Tetrapisispora phaffii CBS 4417]|uniref:Uncharacterized protein n=1 Tax=Tetrapisispora phaffii (strain ATCC 24235 / CBS 4417 / NBRC 1672 / NRRL Y-8282 / UCD 70-5) TaxID=1071381 RepID=G8BZA6_TETPH|nr:hypothetical protein TPHA_0K01000 [Tetrapisispora phaffii CBS 4417]CCE65234.1 hypothetical protein TPHA_0K01000 [Tetrapisispora phaffii CBS 4417]
MSQASVSAISTKENTPNLETDASKDDSKIKAQENAKKPVIPWQNNHKSVEVKTFSGYTLKLKGWVRKDVVEKYQKQSIESVLKEKEEQKREQEQEQQKAEEEDQADAKGTTEQNQNHREEN